MDISKHYTVAFNKLIDHLAVLERGPIYQLIRTPSYAPPAIKQGVNCSQFLQNGLMHLLNASHARQNPHTITSKGSVIHVSITATTSNYLFRAV